MIPCPICHDKGHIERTHSGEMLNHFPCTCPAGKRFAAQWALPQKKDKDNA